MKQRGITPIEVEFILQHPEQVRSSFEGLKEAIGKVQGRMIRIIFSKDENLIKIITVM